MQSTVMAVARNRVRWYRICRAVSGIPFKNCGFVLLRRGNSAATRARVLHHRSSRNEAEPDNVAARLADMRKVLGEEQFQSFLRSACAELHALSRQDEPWPTLLVEQAIAAAMLLGFETLEATCRAIASSAQTEPRPSPRQAAKAAAEILDAFRTEIAP
jgi:hypothetical protein